MESFTIVSVLQFSHHDIKVKKSRKSIIILGQLRMAVKPSHLCSVVICPLPSEIMLVQFSCSVISNSATPWTTAHQASLSITNSRSLLKLMPIESVMPSSHLIFCCPLLLPSSIFPSIRVFSNESALHIRCPKY